MEILGYSASLLMGVILGLMGGGGSILTVPILVYLFALQPSLATGYSLFVVGLTALIGSVSYWRKGDFDFKAGVKFALPSLIGVYISRSILLPSIPSILLQTTHFVLSKETLIMGFFSLLMLGASLSMIRATPIAEETPSDETNKASLRIIVQGFVVGIVVGFVGAGGGFLIVPALVLVSKLRMRIAVGTSLMIIATQSLIGFMGDLRIHPTPDWRVLASVSLMAIVGIISASFFSHKIPERKLRKFFGWFVLIMGSGILIEQLQHI